MQNWTVELTGTSHEDAQNTNEHMQRRKVPSGLLNTKVKIEFSFLEPIKFELPKAQWMCWGIRQR